MLTVKKQKLSELAKSKGIYAFLLVGVFVVVTAVLITVNSQTGTEQENNNLVDLNEEPQELAKEENLKENVKPQIDEADMHADASEPKNNVDEDLTGQERPSTLPGQTTATESEKPVTETAEETTSQSAEETKPVTEVAQNKPVEETKQVITTTVESLSFQPEDGLSWPINGNVIMNYSDDRTVFHETLLQFKTNPAILIQGEAGMDVLASEEGIIASIENRPETGITITMDIGNGYRLVYGQMEETTLKVGDVVEKGEIIGKLATVTKYYTVEGDHLYFQVLNVDTPVNPMLMLKDE